MSEGVTSYSPNINVYELMEIPKFEERVSGFMMVGRDGITLPGVRRDAVRSIAYVEAGIIVKSFLRKRVGPKKIRTGNKADFTNYAGLLYTPNVAMISLLRAGRIMYEGLDKKFRELGITPYEGYITAKRVETNDAVRDGFKARIVDSDYVRIPSLKEMPGMDLVTVDPMLATGSTDGCAIGLYEGRIKKGLPRKLYFAHMLATKIGVEHVIERLRKSPLRNVETDIIVGQIDRGGIKGTGLDRHNYICPGVGDMGDMLASSDVMHAREFGMTLERFKRKYPAGVRRGLESVIPLLKW